MPILPSRTLTITIERTPDAVYAFASAPENLPRWAMSMCRSVAREGDRWVVETDDGRVGIRFADANPFGVLDHVVTLPSSAEVHVPMRVIANGTGSEVLFTLIREPETSEQAYADDTARIESDLRTLKAVLESSAG